MDKDPTRDALAANLKRLMDSSELKTQAKVGDVAEMDQRTVGRILKAEHAPTMTQLVKLARAFNVSPWQLLVPDLDPGALPIVLKNPDERAVVDALRQRRETDKSASSNVQPLQPKPASGVRRSDSISTKWTKANHPGRRAADKKRGL